jgi:hypothetical protein
MLSVTVISKPPTPVGATRRIGPPLQRRSRNTRPPANQAGGLVRCDPRVTLRIARHCASPHYARRCCAAPTGAAVRWTASGVSGDCASRFLRRRGLRVEGLGSGARGVSSLDRRTRMSQISAGTSANLLTVDCRGSGTKFDPPPSTVETPSHIHPRATGPVSWQHATTAGTEAGPCSASIRRRGRDRDLAEAGPAHTHPPQRQRVQLRTALCPPAGRG